VINIVIFKTSEDAKSLQKVLLSEDRTFSPGAGGYSISKVRGRRNIISFIEMDTAPAENYKVGVKGGVIWAGRIAWVIRLILKKNNIPFREEVRNFHSPDEINRAFAKA